MDKKYYIGLDVGTNSVGWSATDDEYNFLRLKGKTAWGARIFSEAESKKDRRSFRSNRRRLQRRKYRIQLLNTLFCEEINKIDNTFFLRLDNASYLFEDKENLGLSRNLLFKDKTKEVEFYKDYPTIWHLRKALINNEEKAFQDIRNIYLALHHIIKYRGNFLQEGNIDYSIFKEEYLTELNEYLKLKYNSLFEDELNIDFISSSKSSKFKSILLDKNLNKTNKQKELKKLFENYKENEKLIKMFTIIVTGGNYRLNQYEKDLEDEINFTKNYDDKVDNIMRSLGEDFKVVEIAKAIYDYVALNDLLNDKSYLSDVMVNIYENHKKELITLKNIIINIDNNKKVQTEEDRLYYQIFKDKKSKVNYSSFIHNGEEDRTDIETFNNYVLKVMKDNEKYVSGNLLNEYKEVVLKLENKNFLKTIALSSTSIIPHQLHLNELNIILDNASKNYPFINEVKEKIITLFMFRNKYYYGPLVTGDKSEFAWCERKSNETVTPWNIESIIDDNKTKQKFINRLTNTCSYLYSEKVMPKASLDFELYLILDRLNVMLVNGLPLIGQEKEKALNYILSRSKTTIEQLKRFLANISNTKVNDVLISNIKQDIPFEASSHAHLIKEFDICIDKDKLSYFIFLATVYADDKKTFKNILLSEYSYLNINQVKCLLSLPTKKWASISSKLLNNIYYLDDNGVQNSILDLMKETNKNFQMILNDKEYNFISIIKEFNDENSNMSKEGLISSLLEETPTIARRSINQTLLIIDDIIKASNKEPEKIFIEVTRNDDENKKGKETNSREVELSQMINSFIKDAEGFYLNQALNIKKEFDEIEKIKLKSRHIYLYFKQMGIDMYTGLPIDLNDVLNSRKYDLDHIIPQSLIKDDSLDNLVLVDREYNQRIKKDYYPIPLEIRNEEKFKLWNYFRKINTITEKKYNNLMRSSEISLEEVENFVARQINVVDYSNITLRNILQIKYPNTKIVFSKSHYPTYIRKTLEIAKNRSLNDAHHAVDAYLNIVAGDILSTEYSNVYKVYEGKVNRTSSKTFNMENTIDRYLRKVDKSEVKYSEKIKNNCLRRDALITFKVDYQTGPLYKQTIYKHEDNPSLIPIHTNENNPMHNTNKYGGYSNLSQSYMMAVQYEEKGKTKKFILRVPLMYDKMYKDNHEELLNKVVNNPNAKNIKVLRKIYLNQKIKLDKGIYLLYTNNEVQNKYKQVYQHYMDNDYLLYLDAANKKESSIDISLDEQEIVKNRKGDKLLISKKINHEIFNSLLSDSKNSIYDTCNYINKFRETDITVFDSLNMKEQLDVINNVIMLLSRDNEKSKLDNKKFNNISSTPNMRPTNNITGTNISIIYESPTGLFSHEVKL